MLKINNKKLGRPQEARKRQSKTKEISERRQYL